MSTANAPAELHREFVRRAWESMSVHSENLSILSQDDLLWLSTHGENGVSLLVEAIRQRGHGYDGFLLETFRNWGVKEERLRNIIFSPRFVIPALIDYPTLARDIDPSKYGEYFLNPSMQGVDFASIPENKITSLALSEYRGKDLAEVATHISTAPQFIKHQTPGIEFWQWVCFELPKASREVQRKYAFLKDGNYHFFFSSLFRSSRGRWSVPCVQWDGSSFNRNGYWLGDGWRADCRAVLLEI